MIFKTVKYFCILSWNTLKSKSTRDKTFPLNRGTVTIVVIKVIGSRTNEETLMKATHTMIRLGQFGASTILTHLG